MEPSVSPGNTRRWATLAIACVASLVLAIDLTVLNLAIPKLTEELGPSATQLLWIADVYGFALAGLLITMGNLADRIGRRRLLLIGVAAFGAASALTAYAPNPQMLIAARALLGIAGATIMPSTLSLVRNAFTDPAERTMAVGIWSGMGAGGFALGPVVGGTLLAHFWWGSVFLINVPLMALIFIAGVIVLPESRNPSPARLDLVSAVLSVAGIVAVVYAIKEAATGGIAQTGVEAASVAGVIALALFGWRQTRLTQPLIDVRLFRDRAFSGSVSSNLVAIFTMSVASLAFSLYLQLVHGWSPLIAGLAQLPGPVSAIFGGVLSAKLISLIGRARVVALGLALCAVSFVLYGQVGLTLDYPYLVFAMLVGGMGIGLTFTVTNDTVLATVPKDRSGAASAISETATELGGALGIAILGSVLTGVYRSDLRLPAGLPAEAVHGIRQSLGGALQTGSALPPGTASVVVHASRQAFVDGLHVTLLTSAAILGVIAVTSLFTLRGVPDVISEATGDAVLVPTP